MMNKLKVLIVLLVLSMSSVSYSETPDVATVTKHIAVTTSKVTKHVAIDTGKFVFTAAKDVLTAGVYLGYGAIKGTVSVGNQIKNGINSEKHKK